MILKPMGTSFQVSSLLHIMNEVQNYKHNQKRNRHPFHLQVKIVFTTFTYNNKFHIYALKFVFILKNQSFTIYITAGY